MTNTDSPLDETISRMIIEARNYEDDNINTIGQQDLAIDIKNLLELYCHKQVIEALERVEEFTINNELKERFSIVLYNYLAEEIAELRKTL